MKIISTEELGVTEERIITESGSIEDVQNQLNSLPWLNLSQLILIDKNNVELEMSGSHGVDGFSVTYTENGRSYISSTGPTYDDCVNIIMKFANADTDWRSCIKFEYWQDADGVVRKEGASVKGAGCMSMFLFFTLFSILYCWQNI